MVKKSSYLKCPGQESLTIAEVQKIETTKEARTSKRDIQVAHG